MSEREGADRRPRSRDLRFMAYVWATFGAISAMTPTPEAYVAMFIIIATILSVGAEILKELGR